MRDGADLATRPTLPLGRAGGEDTFWLEALPEGHVLHVLAGPRADDRKPAEADGWAARRCGPDQWFVVSDAASPLDVSRKTAKLLGKGLAVSDQSHGRARLAISGPRARMALARGSGVDFSDDRFPIGAATATLFNHIGIHVTRTGADRFELLVPRSFARSLWDDLLGPRAMGAKR
jgi:sarcosine oxidase subunit gamma